MNKICFIFLFISSSLVSFADDHHRHGKDTVNIYQKIDTTYIEDYHDLLNVNLIGVVRTNKFSVKDNVTQSNLEYSINTNANMGFGASFKGISADFEYNPPGLNNDDYKYGKSKQYSLSTSANGRCFIYDVYYRYNQGYHTTTDYKVPGATGDVYLPIYRPDIKNTMIGGSLVYIVNNKKFSSSAPYSLTQRQRKSAGSLLIGTFFSSYSLSADSIIFPDSLRTHFKPEVQFKDAASITYGFSCGYTYTFVFGKNWYINLYTLPGLSIQQYYSTNAYNQQSHSNAAIGLSLQIRFSIGYNRKNYFIGLAFTGNNFIINNDKKSSLTYDYGSIRFYYGHRFDIRKILKKIF